MLDDQVENRLRALIHEEINKAVREAIIDDYTKCSLCREPGFADKHREHHRALEEFVELLYKLNEAKWTTIKTVMASMVLGLVMAFLYFFFGIKQP